MMAYCGLISLFSCDGTSSLDSIGFQIQVFKIPIERRRTIRSSFQWKKMTEWQRQHNRQLLAGIRTLGKFWTPEAPDSKVLEHVVTCCKYPFATGTQDWKFWGPYIPSTAHRFLSQAPFLH
jgi:hypothetical protein